MSKDNTTDPLTAKLSHIVSLMESRRDVERCRKCGHEPTSHAHQFRPSKQPAHQMVTVGCRLCRHAEVAHAFDDSWSLSQLLATATKRWNLAQRTPANEVEIEVPVCCNRCGMSYDTTVLVDHDGAVSEATCPECSHTQESPTTDELKNQP